MSIITNSRGRRLVAALGAAGLGLVTMTGLAFAADDEPVTPSVANIDGQHPTSLEIRKYATPDQAWDFAANGKAVDVPDDAVPLMGVQFEVVPVNSIATGPRAGDLDLLSADGWDRAEGLDADAVKADYLGAGGMYTYGTPVTLTTDGDGMAVQSLPQGLYLVREVSPGDNPVSMISPPTLVTLPYPDADSASWLYDVVIYPKNDLSTDTIDKEVMDPDTIVQPDGMTDWKITVPLVGYNPDEGITSFMVNDPLDSRLTYVDGSAVVKILNAGTQVGSDLVAGTDYTVTVDSSNKLVLTMEESGLAKLNENPASHVEVTITTAVNGDGIVENHVDGVVNNWTTEIVPGEGPTTNWATLEVLKYAGEDQSMTLQGAEFQIYRNHVVDGEDAADESELVGTYTTGADGTFDVTLWVGNNADMSEVYWVKETMAPTGYVLPANPWSMVTLTADANATVTVHPVSNVKHTGPALPITGANGQLLMMGGGLALVLLGGGAALVSRKRNPKA